MKSVGKAYRCFLFEIKKKNTEMKVRPESLISTLFTFIMMSGQESCSCEKNTVQSTQSSVFCGYIKSIHLLVMCSSQDICTEIELNSRHTGEETRIKMSLKLTIGSCQQGPQANSPIQVRCHKVHSCLDRGKGLERTCGSEQLTPR